MLWTRRIGLALLVAWAAFWVWFNVAFAFGEGGAHGVEAGHLIQAAVIAAVAAVAWRWPLAGAVALVALAVFGLVLFGPRPFLIVTLFLPAVVSAALLAFAARRGGPRSVEV